MTCSVAVLIVAYNGELYLRDCLNSILQSNFTNLSVTVFVVDNKSSDESARIISEEFPSCFVFQSNKNRGFAGGNVWGWKQIEATIPKLDYLYLLNQDTIVDCDFLHHAVDYLEAKPNVGAAQSLLLLHPETTLVNTAGNALHFLGFGVPTYYRQESDKAPPSAAIGYPSGAAVLLRCEWIRLNGLFAEVLFMYLEDAELGWRLHLMGSPPHLCTQSVVYHKYSFASTLNNYGYLERNRLWLVAVHYHSLTLLMLLPALTIMEVGQWMFALSQGLVRKKLWAYRSLFSREFIRTLILSRAKMQRSRSVRDREILSRMTGEFVSPHISSLLLIYVANPLFKLYLYLLRRLVVW